MDRPNRASIVEETIREKALKVLDDEIPHGIAVEVVTMKKDLKRLVWYRSNYILWKENS